MTLNPSLEADSHVDSQETLIILWNPNGYRP
jgi:hypothetical protein